MLITYSKIRRLRQGQLSRIYACLLEEQIRVRFPASPLPFKLHGWDRFVTFSGSPHLIAGPQIERALSECASSLTENISVTRTQNHLEIKVDPPPDMPQCLLDLKSFYETEKDKIVSREIRKAPQERFHPDNIGPELKTLAMKTLKRAVEIAQGRAREKFSRSENKFAVLLLAGAARGPELDSDLDYMIVYQGENKIYFDYLAEQLKEILYACGLDGDNLIRRFSRNKISALQVNDFNSYYLIFRVAANAVPVETLDDEETLKLFFMNAAQACEYQQRLMRHLSWRDVFYAIEIRSESTSWALLNPALEVRKIFTALGILGIRNGLISSRIDARELLEQIGSKGGLEPFRADEIWQAKLFFERMKNVTWYLYRGATPCLLQSDIPMVAKLLGYNGDTKELPAQISAQKQTANGFFHSAFSRGNFSRHLQTAYNWWRKSKLLLRKFLRFIKYGNAEAIFLSKRPPAFEPQISQEHKIR